MKTAFVITLLVILSTCIYAQTSYIQVVSEADISVFLDGMFKGKTTSDIGGLIIEDVNPGGHIIKVVKEGFGPQEEHINLKSGEVFTYEVKPFIPKIKISQEGNVEQQDINLKVGKIIIQSLPVEISINILGLGISSFKTQDMWSADKVPAGTYSATFEWKEKILTKVFEVTNNQITHLFVNMIKSEIEDLSSMVSNPNVDYGSFTDPRDDQTYKTVSIGNQVWLAQNMNFETGNSWCYDNDFSNCEVYGRLYDWETALELCPTGWHLPNDEEWKQLVREVDSQYNYQDLEWKEGLSGPGSDAGINLKPNGGLYSFGTGTDQYGFTALPGGVFYHSNTFRHLGDQTFFWSSTACNERDAWGQCLYRNQDVVFRGTMTKEMGNAVRCLRDY